MMFTKDEVLGMDYYYQILHDNNNNYEYDMNSCTSLFFSFTSSNMCHLKCTHAYII